MKNKDFIKKYSFYDFKSICDEVETNLSILYHNKKIPKFKIIRKNNRVKFYYLNKFILFDIAEIYSMKDDKIMKIISKKIKEREGNL